jgi:hypothetical protein
MPTGMFLVSSKPAIILTRLHVLGVLALALPMCGSASTLLILNTDKTGQNVTVDATHLIEWAASAGLAAQTPCGVSVGCKNVTVADLDPLSGSKLLGGNFAIKDGGSASANSVLARFERTAVGSFYSGTIGNPCGANTTSCINGLTATAGTTLLASSSLTPAVVDTFPATYTAVDMGFASPYPDLVANRHYLVTLTSFFTGTSALSSAPVVRLPPACFCCGSLCDPSARSASSSRCSLFTIRSSPVWILGLLRLRLLPFVITTSLLPDCCG